MSQQAYRNAIVSIATAEANGEDVEGRIGAVAARIGMNAANVRQEVTEMADLLAD